MVVCYQCLNIQIRDEDLPVRWTRLDENTFGNDSAHPWPHADMVPYVLPHYVQLSHRYPHFLDPHHLSSSRFLDFLKITG